MKKTNLQMIAIMLMSLLCSCSDNEEPTPAKSGAEIAARYRNIFCNSEGDIRLIAAENGADRYLTPANKAENAESMCLALIDDENWKISDGIYNLPDNYGNVSVRNGESDGVFFTMAFNVRGIPSFTLDITSKEYFESNRNMVSYPDWVIDALTIACIKCGAHLPHDNMYCPSCGQWTGDCPVYVEP